mmetsp:Transcript_61003/g.74776  ORF Transcript_61003/g.74776 Transcript_61003/m.74776 type:complete len:394 (+) Transcript_61003:35-1216(+)
MEYRRLSEWTVNDVKQWGNELKLPGNEDAMFVNIIGENKLNGKAMQYISWNMLQPLVKKLSFGSQIIIQNELPKLLQNDKISTIPPTSNTVNNSHNKDIPEQNPYINSMPKLEKNTSDNMGKGNQIDAILSDAKDYVNSMDLKDISSKFSFNGSHAIPTSTQSVPINNHVFPYPTIINSNNSNIPLFNHSPINITPINSANNNIPSSTNQIQLLTPSNKFNANRVRKMEDIYDHNSNNDDSKMVPIREKKRRKKNGKGKNERKIIKFSRAHVGRIVTYIYREFYGFILYRDIDTNKDNEIFFHRQDMIPQTLRCHIGDRVLFDIQVYRENGKIRKKAINVVITEKKDQQKPKQRKKRKQQKKQRKTPQKAKETRMWRLVRKKPSIKIEPVMKG